MPIVISTLACLRGTSAMRCCAGFFMGNSLSDPEDLLILFIDVQACNLRIKRLTGNFQLCRRSHWTSNPTRGRGHIKDRITIPYCSLKRSKEPSVTRDALARAQGFVCHNHVSILWARVSHPEGQERLHSRGNIERTLQLPFRIVRMPSKDGPFLQTIAFRESRGKVQEGGTSSCRPARSRSVMRDILGSLAAPQSNLGCFAILGTS